MELLPAEKGILAALPTFLKNASVTLNARKWETN